MRITGGIYRGRRITAPKGQDVRPTTDMVRQAVFNILQKYDLPAGAAVADICCGTGALGLEALSRGAERCVFMDKSRESLRFCKENAQALGAAEVSSFVQRDGQKPGAAPYPAGLLFLDPPYRRGLTAPILTALAHGGWLAPAALCVAECEKDMQEDVFPAGFTVLERRPYGDSVIFIVRAALEA